MSKKPEDLQTIDPTTLGNVTGGTTSSGGSSDVTAALQGVMDSLSALKNQKSGGMDSTTMMMMMMMMGGQHRGPTVVAAPANTVGGYAGYTIDGVYYPFFK